MTAQVRAKFRVESITHTATHDPNDICASLVLKPVYNDGPENASWSKWTPNGKLEMTITNPAAIEKFSIGKSYYLDFTPAD